jgi:hypothetical protein
MEKTLEEDILKSTRLKTDLSSRIKEGQNNGRKQNGI